MDLTAMEIAGLLGGEVEGDGSARVRKVSRIESGKEGDVCFLANPKYEKYAYTCHASVLLTGRDWVPAAPVAPTLVRVDNPYEGFAVLLAKASEGKAARPAGRSLLSFRRWSSSLGKGVSLGAFSTVGRRTVIGNGTAVHSNVSIGDDCTIGSNCTFYPGVRIYPGTIIGNNVTIHANAVIGSDGFGNVRLPDGSWRKIEHLGNVVIGNDVEIGAGTTVDRSETGSTVIGNGVKIDNLCQIAHNVQIGDNTAIAALTGIAGSAKIGRNCMIAGQVGINGHITIADGTVVAGQSGVSGNVREGGQTLFGSPAIPIRTYMRAYAKFRESGKE